VPSAIISRCAHIGVTFLVVGCGVLEQIGHAANLAYRSVWHSRRF
jgi:hypothetical protein